MKQIKDKDLIFLDVETTGLSPIDGDRIVEVAALKIRDFKEAGRFTTLVNPGREISYEAFLVNRITPAMIKNAPPMKDVVSDLLLFIGGGCVIGHNIKFDLQFLNHELRLAGKEPLGKNPVVDTIRMARALMPDLPSYSLASVASILGIRLEQKHRAMSDVELTFEIFIDLLDKAKGRNITDFEQLISVFGYHDSADNYTQNKIRLINDAIVKKNPLHLVYWGVHSGTTERKVTPYRVEGEGPRTTLIGFCHLRNEERNFLVQKIIHIETLSN